MQNLHKSYLIAFDYIKARFSNNGIKDRIESYNKKYEENEMLPPPRTTYSFSSYKRFYNDPNTASVKLKIALENLVNAFYDTVTLTDDRKSIADINTKGIITTIPDKVLLNIFKAPYISNEESFVQNENGDYKNLKFHDGKLFTGEYLIFSLTTEGRVINMYPTKISDDGSVKMKHGIDNIFYYGVSYYDEASALSIFIYKMAKNKDNYDKPYFFHLLYSVLEDMGIREGQHAFGVYSRKNRRLNPKAGVSIILKLSNSFNDFEFKEIPVDTIDFDTFIPENFKKNSLFATFFPEVIKFMRGNLDRTIAVPRTPHNEFPDRQEEVKNLYFKSAIFEILKMGNFEDEKKVVEYLKKAWLHGFGSGKQAFLDYKLLEKYKDKLSKYIELRATEWHIKEDFL